MYPTTFNTETDLSAVNSILGSIGQAPVQSLTFENPEVSFVYNLLMEVSTDVQTEGWAFNTEWNYPLTPNEYKCIVIPENILQMDVNEMQEVNTYDVVRRDGKLYNRRDHTFEWDKKMNVDIVWRFEFNDLPVAFKRYITYRAAGRAAAQLVTNPQLVQLLATQEGQARAACMEYECNQGDYSYFGTPAGVKYRSFKPYQTLAR